MNIATMPSCFKACFRSAGAALIALLTLLSAAQAQLADPAQSIPLAPIASASPTPSTPLQLVPVTPCRLVDTRNSNGPFGGPPIQGGSSRSFPVPQGSCSIPSNAAAYQLNVTVIPNGRLSYLTVYPTGADRGLTTTMNSVDGRLKADAVIVPAGTGQAISVYASDTTNVVIDIYGYFAAASQSTLAFFRLPTCRLIDTRNPNGPLGGPFLSGGVERDFPVLTSSCMPVGVEPPAYSLNVTVLPRNGGRLGFLTVWAAGHAQPTVALLNDLTGTVVSNAIIVTAGTSGAIAVYASNDTDLVVDINGFFDPPATGGLSLYTIAPCRLLDTRKSVFGFSGEITVPVTAAGNPCGLPASAEAFAFNATAYPQGPLNYLTLWADGQPRPDTWTLNAVDGAITSNLAIVSTVNGSIDAFASGTTHLALDLSSYFAP